MTSWREEMMAATTVTQEVFGVQDQEDDWTTVQLKSSPVYVKAQHSFVKPMTGINLSGSYK